MADEEDFLDNWLHEEWIVCPACQRSLFRIDTSPMDHESYLYCDRCPIRIGVSVYEMEYQQIEHLLFNGQKEETDYVAFRKAIEAHLQPCTCGGTFRYDAPRRCFTCFAPVIIDEPGGVDLYPDEDAFEAELDAERQQQLERWRARFCPDPERKWRPFSEAECWQAVRIAEQHQGMEHPETASHLSNLAVLYAHQGRYEESERLHQQALAICESQLGEEHPYTARILHNMSMLLVQMGKDQDAEPLLMRALSIRRSCLGEDHPETARSCAEMAGVYAREGKVRDARLLYQQALAMYTQASGEGHSTTRAVQAQYTHFCQQTQQEEEP